MAFASQGVAHGAMGMAGHGGMAMQPQPMSPHPFDPSGHLNGPSSPAPFAPRMQPWPSAPRLDPPGNDAVAGGGGMAAQPPNAGPHPFDPSGHLNGPPNPTPTAPRAQPAPSAPRLDPPGNDAGMSTNGPDTRTHARFANPSPDGTDASGNANVMPSAPQLDPK
jgi:hypothetical protein